MKLRHIWLVVGKTKYFGCKWEPVEPAHVFRTKKEAEARRLLLEQEDVDGRLPMIYRRYSEYDVIKYTPTNREIQ